MLLTDRSCWLLHLRASSELQEPRMIKKMTMRRSSSLTTSMVSFGRSSTHYSPLIDASKVEVSTPAMLKASLRVSYSYFKGKNFFVATEATRRCISKQDLDHDTAAFPSLSFPAETSPLNRQSSFRRETGCRCRSPRLHRVHLPQRSHVPRSPRSIGDRRRPLSCALRLVSKPNDRRKVSSFWTSTLYMLLIGAMQVE